MTQKKILYIQPNSVLGGSFQSLYYLLRNLNRSLYDPTVLFPQKNQHIIDRLKEIHVKSFIKPFPIVSYSINSKYRILLYTFFHYILLHKYYLRTYTTLPFDILHLNSLNSLFGLALANKFRIPAVWHIREQLSSILYNIPQMIFSQMAGESVIKHILCISENEATKLPESKVTILHNFFILDKQPCPRKKPIMFLSMGSFSMDKGFWLLIDAVKMLKHFHTPEDFRVSIMGISTRSTITKKLLREKTSEDFTNKIYREGIAEYFEFLPPQIDIRPDLFSQFHVLIRPSLNNDPWGRDIIEAMSTGRAVIATGTYSKFVRDGLNGFLVPSSDPRLLAERMQQFIKNESLAMQFGEKSYGLAQKLFDPQSITRDIENIYNTMTSSV